MSSSFSTSFSFIVFVGKFRNFDFLFSYLFFFGMSFFDKLHCGLLGFCALCNFDKCVRLELDRLAIFKEFVFYWRNRYEKVYLVRKLSDPLCYIFAVCFIVFFLTKKLKTFKNLKIIIIKKHLFNVFSSRIIQFSFIDFFSYMRFLFIFNFLIRKIAFNNFSHICFRVNFWAGRKKLRRFFMAWLFWGFY